MTVVHHPAKLGVNFRVAAWLVSGIDARFYGHFNARIFTGRVPICGGALMIRMLAKAWPSLYDVTREERFSERTELHFPTLPI